MGHNRAQQNKRKLRKLRKLFPWVNPWKKKYAEHNGLWSQNDPRDRKPEKFPLDSRKL